jgi:regulatory protein
MSEDALFKTALNRSMTLCARREYCVSDILAKLDSWGISESTGWMIIGKLKKENFINEERYASGFVKDKFRYNRWGRIKITSHLKAKGIPEDIIKKALDSIDNELYGKILSDLISSHRRLVKAKNQYDLKAKLLRYGLSKGFESSLLYDLLNEMEE